MLIDLEILIMAHPKIHHQKRLAHQKKKAQKGIKSMRGQPEYYDELKERVSICITRTARQRLDEMSQNIGVSRSELIERIGQGTIKILFPDDLASE
jgi:hypothetical protein